jgi:small-conductance mechanosensitive channel
MHTEVGDPVVRFNNFNDSSLDFALRVFVKDYGAQFKMKSEMRIIMYEEFKNYDIRIPWPIRTIYQGDEKKEAEEIGKFDEIRNKVVDEYGTKETEGSAEDE